MVSITKKPHRGNFVVNRFLKHHLFYEWLSNPAINMKLTLIFFLLIITGVHAQTPVPELFLGAKLNTNLQERDMAISPDGSEMFYTLQSGQGIFSTILFRRKLANGSWSDPEVASFSGKFGDLEPAFSPDGKKLYFASNRPVPGVERRNYDIWVTERSGSSWSEPKNLGESINTPDAHEYYPSISANGNLYYTAHYPNNVGGEDIQFAKWTGEHFEKSVPLDTAVNSTHDEFNAFVSLDESFIVFSSYGRSDDTGGGDLYISKKDPQGKWQKAVNLKALNSRRLDYCPYVSFDKKLFYFTSNRFDIPNSYEKATTYKDLQSKYNGALNGSDNIYVVGFDALK
jgi:Tol biopolymer transport system component